MQTAPPDQIILSVTKPEDLPTDIGRASVVTSPMGLTLQRNAGLAALHSQCDIVSFLDDDVELATDYFQQLREVFELNPDALGCTGSVIADGAGIGGITREVARQKLAEAAITVAIDPITATTSMYGCNMNVRSAMLNQIRFDGRLAAYAWLEDFDFSSRVAAKGKLVFAPSCRLVHLATTSGRTSGVRMGIAQILNPLYLYKKGIFRSFPQMLRQSWLQTVPANIAGVLIGRHAKHVDRKGRLKGNLIGLGYVLRGKVDPEVVLRHK